MILTAVFDNGVSVNRSSKSTFSVYQKRNSFLIQNDANKEILFEYTNQDQANAVAQDVSYCVTNGLYKIENGKVYTA